MVTYTNYGYLYFILTKKANEIVLYTFIDLKGARQAHNTMWEKQLKPLKTFVLTMG